MTADRVRFDRFTLDPANRQLSRDGVPVDLNARYFDALALLAGNAGALVSKDRFLAEVWRGVPVTDEALTQCIKSLRRQLGDDAASPRFIETVPKHGYRFVATVTGVDAAPAFLPPPRWRASALTLAAGTAGGGLAGIIGGLFYGLTLSHGGAGGVSSLLVLVTITFALALIGGAGVSAGIATAQGRGGVWLVTGGAMGGLIVGAIVKLVGVDAFDLLFGQSPGDITGPLEGALLGGATGLGMWAVQRADISMRRTLVMTGAIGAIGGIVIAVLGGRLMGGSLAVLAHQFPGSQLRLDRLGALFGEADFGLVSRVATTTLEGAVFVACVVGAIAWSRRYLVRARP